MRLEGKVALISGGARGMGAVEARLFAREGAKVAIADILAEEGKKLESDIAESGGEALFVTLDVTREEAWIKAVSDVVARFGRLDILVNNAGIYRLARVEDTTEEGWDTVLDVNAKGVFLGTKAAIPAMRTGGGGSIVNISSVAGIIGSLNSTAYNASKGAVRLLTKTTAIQYAQEGIRVNSVHPGPIDTEMLGLVFPDEETRNSRLSNIPMGRMGTAADVANGVLFLASDESSYMTGSELVIDGGYTSI
ncbi:MAG: glucose 1-dehydrogenase [Chloroflexi bacterium]|nr:glucose 1-dehydrogenase [Chloroflexota bacterium]MDA1227142.1 glucose 1-dehydrogenase [Chloroflexota bacterium]